MCQITGTLTRRPALEGLVILYNDCPVLPTLKKDVKRPDFLQIIFNYFKIVAA